MDRRVGYADTNLIWPERRGGAVFDPKHSRRFSEFVVDDSSHVNLQRLDAGRRIAIRALNVVSPAHNSGAASTDDRSSGIDTSPLGLAIITSAYSPS
jgi:hypothetical protein